MKRLYKNNSYPHGITFHHFHDDNKFEEIAERWGKKEYTKWKNKL